MEKSLAHSNYFKLDNIFCTSNPRSKRPSLEALHTPTILINSPICQIATKLIDQLGSAAVMPNLKVFWIEKYIA